MKLLILIFCLFQFNSVYTSNETVAPKEIISKLPKLITDIQEYMNDLTKTGKPYELYESLSKRIKEMSLQVMTCYSDIMYQSVVKKNSKNINKELASIPKEYAPVINLLDRFVKLVKDDEYLTPVNDILGRLGIYDSTVRMNFHNLIDSLYYQSEQYYKYFQYKYKIKKISPHNEILNLLTLPQNNGSNLIQTFRQAVLCNSEFLSVFCLSEMNVIFKSFITEAAYFGSIGKLEMTALDRQEASKSIDKLTKSCSAEMRLCVENWPLYLEKSLQINFNKNRPIKNHNDFIKRMIFSIHYDVPQRAYLGVVHSPGKTSNDFAVTSTLKFTKLDDKNVHLSIFSRTVDRGMMEAQFNAIKTDVYDKVDVSSEKLCNEKRFWIFSKNKYKGRHAAEILNRYTKVVKDGVVYVAKKSLGMAVSKNGGNLFVKDVIWPCDKNEVYQVVIYV